MIDPGADLTVTDLMQHTEASFHETLQQMSAHGESEHDKLGPLQEGCDHTLIWLSKFVQRGGSESER